LNGVAIAVVLLVAVPALAQMPMTPGGAHASPTQPKTTAPASEPMAQANKPVVHRRHNRDTVANQLNRQELRYGAVPPPVAQPYPPPGFPPPTYFPFAPPPSRY
jgi:hypothetical protein